MIKLWFSDIDWTSKNGDTVKMNTGREYFINTRLTHIYTPPIITEDTWGGITSPVQINIWDSYNFQFGTKELSIDLIPKIQACKVFYIESLDTNELIEVDTTTSGSILIEPIDRYLTSNQSFSMTVRANKISTYPGIVRDNINTLTAIVDSITYTYYTDYDVIEFMDNSELSQYTNGSGVNYTAKTIQKKGVTAIFYMMEADAIDFKEYIEKCEASNLSINSFVNIETALCEIAELTEGLFKCMVKMYTSSEVKYAENNS